MKRLPQRLVRVSGWACALLLLSCQKQDEGVPVEQPVQFSFHYTAPSVTGGRTEDVLAGAAFIFVKVSDAAHQPVKARMLPLINFNGKLISEPISLLPGNYFITEFLVTDKWGGVMLATPREGSDLAYLVVDPLDISMPISKDEVSEFAPEVVAIGEHHAEDFGYASFTFQYVKTFDFLIAVAAYDSVENKLNLTEAKVSISGPSHTPILQQTIPAATALLTMPDVDQTFTVLVEKEGYSAYKESFTTAQLKQYFSSTENGPLLVTLRMGHLVFWNALGSDDEVMNSLVGPGLSFYNGNDGLNIPANHEYGPAQVGNGITIAPGYYGVLQRAHNVVMTDPGSVINPERGAISCYFRQNISPVAYSQNPYRIFDGGYGLDSGLGVESLDFNGDGLANALAFVFTLGGATPIVVYSMNFDAYNGQWIHVAAVWDRAGINGTTERMRIYINGEKTASGQELGWGTTFGPQVDIAGGNSDGNNIARQFYVDELKIYDYAKTDY
ncbi:Concanavalin A-like lectin/glucanases superfamily protein [Chryseolinea serpens]|uniref:Concanavalin A-like lectin/glucanases superfamily protein n=1 Tax=Chryseolinea serpens TaxID=947013 RepID=A0A1M5JNG0_9BACT|nr:LamG-like jellyroll fold domain-containing protein [Chryseolinea serpens]SHG42068.1 Concanavalin A-like lectin/glucanases superfamily protein [Chryseolinea serpens]